MKKIIKILITLIVLMIAGCNTTRDERPPLMNDKPFTNFVPSETPI